MDENLKLLGSVYLCGLLYVQSKRILMNLALTYKA